MKRNVSIVRFKFRCNVLISGKIIKEMPGSVASGTPYIILYYIILYEGWNFNSGNYLFTTDTK